MFYEYFHGDTGTGVGASHQTGWTGAIARIMRLFASAEADQVLEQGKGEAAGTVGPSREATHRPARSLNIVVDRPERK